MQLIVLPPVEASKPLSFVSAVEEVLRCNLSQIDGSWQTGMVFTLSLKNSMPAGEIMRKLEIMPEVKAVAGRVPSGQTIPRSIEKVVAMSRLKSNNSMSLFITL